MQVATMSRRLADQNLDLLKSGNFSDAEIVCRGKVWKVHKLILRSRCLWFEKAFANNWQEAQTGRVHLEEEQPEQVDALLHFIYLGTYVQKLRRCNALCIPSLILERNVSLWRTADYFLLPELMDAIYEYLLEWFAATLCYFHKFSLFGSSNDVVHTYDIDAKYRFFDRLHEAVEKIYKCPNARKLHRLFAVFVCGLREHWPMHEGLMERIPEFQQDVSTALIALHFPWATGELPGLDLGNSYTSPERNSERLIGKCTEFKCSRCGKQRSLQSQQQRDREMTLDPFSSGVRKWCNDCAFQSIKYLLETMVSACRRD